MLFDDYFLRNCTEFLVEISAKNDKFGYPKIPNPILWKLSVTYDLGSYEANMYISSAVFLFALKFYPDSVVPNQPFLHQKTRDTGPSGGEDRIPLSSLVLTHYRSVTDAQTGRRTDGRTDLP